MCTASHYNVTYVYTLYIITGIVRGRIQIGNVTPGERYVIRLYMYMCILFYVYRRVTHKQKQMRFRCIILRGMCISYIMVIVGEFL